MLPLPIDLPTAGLVLAISCDANFTARKALEALQLFQWRSWHQDTAYDPTLFFKTLMNVSRSMS